VITENAARCADGYFELLHRRIVRSGRMSAKAGRALMGYDGSELCKRRFLCTAAAHGRRGSTYTSIHHPGKGGRITGRQGNFCQVANASSTNTLIYIRNTAIRTAKSAN